MNIKDRIGKEFIVFDGGFGSQLQARGVKTGENSAEINIKDPDLVTAIHKDYLKAGAMCLTTNTFGADRYLVSRIRDVT